MSGHLQATKISPKLFKHKAEMRFRYFDFDIHYMEKWINDQCSNTVWYRKHIVKDKQGQAYEIVMELWFKNKSDAMLYKLMFYQPEGVN